MSEKPLDILKIGLSRLRGQITERKNKLLSHLSQNEKISPAEEEWLDNDANLVDEEVLIQTLEEASDYEQKIATLDTKQYSLVQKLMEFVNGTTPASIYDIDQLEVMRLADLAWHEVDASMIRNCWHHAGILPKSYPSTEQHSTPSISIAMLLRNTEQDLARSLGWLEERGVLSRRNRITIDELLNPAQENEVIESDTSDQDICDAVRAKHTALQNLEANGGDDDDDNTIIKKPSRREALAASMTLQQYVSDMKDPFARQLEGILVSFRRQTRLEELQSLRSTQITDYFSQIPRQ